MTQVGHELRLMRREAGLTQAQVATRAGLSRSGLVAIESGRRPPSPEMVLEVLDAIRGRDRTYPELRLDPQTLVNIERSRSAAFKIAAEPIATRAVVEHELGELRSRAAGSSSYWLDFWDAMVCQWDVAEIVRLLLSTGPEDVDRRKVSPVYVLLTEEDNRAAVERAKVLWRATRRPT